MDKIIQITTQPWAIEPSANDSFRMALVAAMRAGQIDAFEKRITADTISAKVYSPSVTGMVVDGNDYNLESLDIPDDSVAIIFVEGCIYPWKSFRLEEKISKVNGNPKLLGALLLMNTPGGAIHRVDITSDVIAKSKKPIAAYVTGMCASAGMYLVSGAKRIFVASLGDRLGSIGTMTTYTDTRKYFEEMGLVETDIYATRSTEKNAESRAMQAGDDKPIVASLDYVNELFHKNISTNRNIAYDIENPIFKGAIFHAQEAIANGLADQMGTLDEALNWVLVEGMKMQANSL